MDLRPHLKDRPQLLAEGLELIKQRDLWYQPLILADGIEVGEGQNLFDRYRSCQDLFDWNVYLSDEHRHHWAQVRGKLAADPRHFRRTNAIYRAFYDRVAGIIAEHVDVAGASFLEIGCNTGLNLFNVAVRGARRCTGVDWTNHAPVIDWLNRVLGTDVRFIAAGYDNLTHTLPDAVPEADVVINTVFMNHQCDPLQFLCCLADRARRGVMLVVLLDGDPAERSISFGEVSGIHDLGAGKPFPLSIHNNVRLSKAMLSDALRGLGFEPSFPDPHDGVRFRELKRKLRWLKGMEGFTMVYGARVRETRSAYHRPPAGD
jgi:SAM-dependent methyltransferase